MLKTFRSKILFSMIMLVLAVSVFLVTIIIDHADNILIEKAHDTSDDILNTMGLYLRKESQSFAKYKEFVLSNRKKELENQTDLVFSYFDDYYDKYKNGYFTEAEAKNFALQGLRNFRYSNNEYFFAFNNKLIMISHPKEKLIGIDANKVTDKKGKFHVKEMYGQALEKGSGSTMYNWPRLNGQGDSLKLGYGEVYKKWNWFILSGVYIDDINREIDKRYQEILVNLRSLFSQIKGQNNLDYLFLIDGKGKLLIHPYLEGKNLVEMDALNGKNLFEELVKASKSDKGYEYVFFKEDDRRKIFKKTAYVEYIKELDWYVVNSIYQDELRKNNKIVGVYLVIVIFVMIIIAFFVSYYLSNQLSKPIEEISRELKKVDFESDTLITLSHKGTQEVVLLSKFLESTIRSLNTSYRKNTTLVNQLRDHQKDLEKKVKERTIELDTKNSELVNTIDKMNHYREQLVAQEKLASLASVIAGIAHELKNPLNLIINSVKMLNHDVNNIGEDDFDQKRVLKACSIIENQGYKADDIIKNMLAISTSSSKEKSTVSLKEVVEERALILQETADSKEQKDINIVVDAEDVGKREVCVSDFKKLLDVLISNSIYSLSHCKEPIEEPLIKVSLKKVDSNIKLEVIDNGPGIPEDVVDSIFNPFFTTKPPGDGTGLGLSLAHDIILSMSGHIELVSHEKGNVNFLVTLEDTES